MATSIRMAYIASPMLKYTRLKPPVFGTQITRDANGELTVPDNPIIPFIEGDGTGPDIWAASVRVFDAAVAAAYAGKRKIAWYEIYAGEKANQIYGPDTWLPDDTTNAILDYQLAIKGPLTTPVGGGIRSINVRLRQVLDLAGMPQAMTRGWEAEDAIGAICAAAGQRDRLEIVSGDRDLIQLVRDPVVKLLYTVRGVSDLLELDEALVLEKYGVPRDAIVTLDQPVEITETELRAVAVAARDRGWRRLILVTAPFHTRRVQLIWGRESGGVVEGRLAAVPDECATADAWWRRRRCSEFVLHEYLGLLALYLHISSLMR